MAVPIAPYLESNFRRARPILFIGAGFSRDCKNILGEPMPLYSDLTRGLWQLCFPGEPFDENTTLQHVYESALLQRSHDLKTYLIEHLTVDLASIPEWYRAIFSLPWYKCYTLNIDNLVAACERKFSLPRHLITVSGASPTADSHKYQKGLSVIYLNGTLEDVPEAVTFSLTQYATRLATSDLVYMQLAADLLSHPFVFIGTRLDEPPLWQHVQIRASKGSRKLRELRPHSVLVTPHLDKAREAVLASYNLSWVEAEAADFTTNILEPLLPVAQEGFAVLGGVDAEQLPKTEIPKVSDLIKIRGPKSEFLLGSEPQWFDIQSGRAIIRECDGALLELAKERLAESDGSLIAVSGTAASGKSTSLMRVALTLANEGVDVAWIDKDTDLSPHAITEAYGRSKSLRLLAMDDASGYGAQLPSLLREMILGKHKTVVLIAVRSANIDKYIKSPQLKRIHIDELVMPALADSDIDDLLAVLEHEHRLGQLQELPFHKQNEVFRSKCGRQLLVAMIEATSGEKFETKAYNELEELQLGPKQVYALIAVASAFRFSISQNEILIALGDATNQGLNDIQLLSQRHIIEPVLGNSHLFRARHRRIAEIIFDHLQKEGQLYDTILGLIFAAAAQLSSTTRRTSRPYRMLVHFLNHDFLHRCFDVPQARQLYDDLEGVLNTQHHFWLQRGSLELENGSLPLAQNFLGAAQALCPTDPIVACTQSHLLFKRALSNVGAVEAPAWVKEATSQLIADIAARGETNYHPYHILGSQSLAWCRRGLASFEEKKSLLEWLKPIMEEGAVRHPQPEMVALRNTIRDEYLNLALRN